MFLKGWQNSQQNILSGVSLLIKLQAGNLKPTEATTGDKQPVLEYLFNKVAYLLPATLSKKTLTLVLSYKICNYFKEHLCMSTCKLSKQPPRQVFVSEFCELFGNTYFVHDLQTTDSERPVRGSLFNKAASLAARRPLTVLKRDQYRCELCEIFRKAFLQNNHFSHDVAFSFQQFSEVCSL